MGKGTRRYEKRRREILEDKTISDVERAVQLAKLDQDRIEEKEKQLQDMRERQQWRRDRDQEPPDKSVSDFISDFNGYYEAAIVPNVEEQAEGAPESKRWKRLNPLFNKMKYYFTKIQEHDHRDDSDVEGDVMSVDDRFKSFSEQRPTWRGQYNKITQIGEPIEFEKKTNKKKKKKKKKQNGEPTKAEKKKKKRRKKKKKKKNVDEPRKNAKLA